MPHYAVLMCVTPLWDKYGQPWHPWPTLLQEHWPLPSLNSQWGHWPQQRLLCIWSQRECSSRLLYNSRREADGWCYCHALAHGSHPHLGCHLPQYICTFPLAAGSQSSGCCGLSHGTPEAREVCRANCHTPFCPQANAYKRRLERPCLATTCCSGLQWRSNDAAMLDTSLVSGELPEPFQL